MFPITVNIYFPILAVTAVGAAGLLGYFVKNPDKLEALVALLMKGLRTTASWAEKTYVKFLVQSKVDGFITHVAKIVPNLSVKRVKLQWVDSNAMADDFFEGDQLVVRMRKSTSTNRNVVNATVAFVSSALLMKAKKYIANYQREAIDLFATTRILQHEDAKLVADFVELYLAEALENAKVNEMYAKFDDIDKVGLFFPVFITEMTFLGEKVFGKARNNAATYEEVNNLSNFLRLFANRKADDKTVTDFEGTHCKFTIRIMGKRDKISKDQKHIYIKDLTEVSKRVETLYIVGHRANSSFIDDVVRQSLTSIPYYVFNKYDYESTIKKKDGTDIQVNSHLVVLRNQKAKVFHRV